MSTVQSLPYLKPVDWTLPKTGNLTDFFLVGVKFDYHQILSGVPIYKYTKSCQKFLFMNILKKNFHLQEITITDVLHVLQNFQIPTRRLNMHMMVENG